MPCHERAMRKEKRNGTTHTQFLESCCVVVVFSLLFLLGRLHLVPSPSPSLQHPPLNVISYSRPSFLQLLLLLLLMSFFFSFFPSSAAVAAAEGAHANQHFCGSACNGHGLRPLSARLSAPCLHPLISSVVVVACWTDRAAFLRESMKNYSHAR